MHKEVEVTEHCKDMEHNISRLGSDWMDLKRKKSHDDSTDDDHGQDRSNIDIIMCNDDDDEEMDLFRTYLEVK